MTRVQPKADRPRAEVSFLMYQSCYRSVSKIYFGATNRNQPLAEKLNLQYSGGMAEWSNAPVLKTGVALWQP